MCIVFFRYTLLCGNHLLAFITKPGHWKIGLFVLNFIDNSDNATEVIAMLFLNGIKTNFVFCTSVIANKQLLVIWNWNIHTTISRTQLLLTTGWAKRLAQHPTIQKHFVRSNRCTLLYCSIRKWSITWRKWY